MKHFVALLFVVVALVAIAPARAALVYDGYATGPGGFSTPYPAVDPVVFAGIIQINYGSSPLLVMSDDYTARVNVGATFPLTIYTYAEVMAGAPVRFTPAQYARAGTLLHDLFPMDLFPSYAVQTFATANGNSTLATFNTQLWDIMSSTSCPAYWDACSMSDTFNWSGSMLIASGGLDEFLIPINTAQTTLTSTPIPAAVWLLGSGLLGLVAVARRSKK